ncbi:MAG TPA: GNAT family N-acetyltransferase [Acidimicrobiales bacterium]|jgi:RimJ/RimL family protein N-acetyltransferase|nr:GNAT family N-acetyltransferase [Acidimicrobiales bacterium]
MASLPERLVSKPVELQRWSEDHLDEAMSAVATSFPQLHQWMEWAASLPTREAIGGYIQYCVTTFDADEDWQYCLREHEGGALVGGAGLNRRGGPNEVEIGYWVRSDRCGRGYATAAARSLTGARRAARRRERPDLHGS